MSNYDDKRKADTGVDPMDVVKDIRNKQMQDDVRSIRDELRNPSIKRHTTSDYSWIKYSTRDDEIKVGVIVITALLAGIPFGWVEGLVSAFLGFIVGVTVILPILAEQRKKVQEKQDAGKPVVHDEFLKEIKAGNIEVIKAMIEAGRDVNAPGEIVDVLSRSNYSPSYLPLEFAVKEKNFQIAEMLIRAGAMVDGTSKNHPIFYAISNLDLKMLILLIENGAKMDVRDSWEGTPLYALCESSSKYKDDFLPVFNKVLEQKPNVNLKKIADVIHRENKKTPLEIALERSSGIKEDFAVIDALIAAGAEISPAAKVNMARLEVNRNKVCTTSDVKNEVKQSQLSKVQHPQVKPTPLHKCSNFKDIKDEHEMVFKLVSYYLKAVGIEFRSSKDYAGSLLKQSQTMEAVLGGIEEWVEHHRPHIKDKKEYAKGLLDNRLRNDKRLNGNQKQGIPGTSIKALLKTIPSTTPASTSQQIRPREIDNQIKKSLHGLVGIEAFQAALSYDIKSFSESSGSTGVCRILWGHPATGKTEIAQRLSGMRDGFPKILLETGRVFYLSGIDGKIEIKKIVEEVPEGSVIFIDEADKCLDFKSGMVSQTEATQLHASLLTNLGRKRLYWAFLGSFVARRGKQTLTNSMLQEMLGPELAGRIDFLDWELPEWSLENLLIASRDVFKKLGMTYEDDAILLLAQECIQTGSGVRGMENILSQIKRSLTVKRSDKLHVDKTLVASYLEKLHGRKAS